ncbi:MAG: hypothetical protein JW891_10800 [Candidatus Lokiarchaeota archaeon]|nr:hypothetical protein [Candidatus Lokiarchaeota archaeon]
MKRTENNSTNPITMIVSVNCLMSSGSDGTRNNIKIEMRNIKKPITPITITTGFTILPILSEKLFLFSSPFPLWVYCGTSEGVDFETCDSLAQ